MTHTSFAASRRGRRSNLTRIGALLLVAISTSVTGCGGDKSTAPTESPEGVYSLERVDQKAVPVEIYRGPYDYRGDGRFYNDFRVTMTGGTLELDDSGDYYSVMSYRLLEDGVEETGTLQAQGTYSVQGTEITFARDNGRDTARGRLGKGTVTMFFDIVGKGGEKPYTFTN